MRAANAFQTGERLGSNYLDEDSLAPSAVEFAVENLFPRPEVQFAFGDRDDDFAAHDLALEVGVGVVFTGAIVPVGAGGHRIWAFGSPSLRCSQPAGNTGNVRHADDEVTSKRKHFRMHPSPAFQI